MDRRSMLRAVLALATAAAAGCQSLGGPDTDQTATTATETAEAVNFLRIEQSRGWPTATDSPDGLGGVVLTVSPCCGTGDIDLTALTLQWVWSRGTHHLVHEAVYDGDHDGAYALGPVGQTPTAPVSPVLADESERANLVVDLGRSEPAAGADNVIADAYETTLSDAETIGEHGLEDGETATVQVTAASGGVTEERLVVPETCSCRGPIHL